MRGRSRAPVVPAAGERVLAWADTEDGAVAGTRDALYLPDPGQEAAPLRVAWHEIETADWDIETGVLAVREVGSYGHERPEHRLRMAEPGRLLELVRERITASIVLTRYVALGEAVGLTVVGRRALSGVREIAWFVEYDAEVDPGDAFVAIAVQNALDSARAEVGET